MVQIQQQILCAKLNITHHHKLNERLAFFSTHSKMEDADIICSSWKFINKDELLVASNFERKISVSTSFYAW